MRSNAGEEATMQDRLEIREEGGAMALNALREEWQELFRNSAAAPFLSWEWAAAWHERLGEGAQPRLICARSGGKLVGLLPLVEEEHRLTGLPVRARRLRVLGEGPGAADYLDVIAHSGWETLCADAIFAHLASDGAYDLIDFDSLSTDSPSLPMLALRFGESSRFHLQFQPRNVCPLTNLDPDPEATVGRSRRAGYFNYCRRRISRLPGYEFRAVTSPLQIEQAFERFLALHEARWAQRGSSDATSSPRLREFHRRAVRSLSEAGLVRFEEIWAEGACRASLYGIESGDRYCFYLSGYDPSWSKYSLGFTLIGLSLMEAARRGLRYYDFLRGAEAYKFDWAPQSRATVAVQIASQSAAARLGVAQAHAGRAAREAAKALLPLWAQGRLRAWNKWRARRAAENQGRETKATSEVIEQGVRVAMLIFAAIC